MQRNLRNVRIPARQRTKGHRGVGVLPMLHQKGAHAEKRYPQMKKRGHLMIEGIL